MTGRATKRRLLTAALLCTGVLFLLPLLVTVGSSFMGEGELMVNYASGLTTFDILEGVTERFKAIRLIPERVTLAQYFEVLLGQPSFLLLLGNSARLTLPVMVGSLAVSLLTAYGFTVWDWKHKEAIFSIFIVVMLMPLQAVLVPNYIVADMLGIRTSYLAIILPGIFSPFGVFLMRQSMKVIPPAYFEAARIDGAGDLYIFLHIILPQMKSAIAALCMLTFIEYWNLVEQAVIFLDDYRRQPLSVYLSRIAEGRMGIIFAASCVYLFLPLWSLMLGQKSLEQGIELSGVK